MPGASTSGFAALQRFVRRDATAERCELCGAAVAEEHEHLIEPSTRRLVCVCQACAILFSGQSGQRYKRVPSRIRFLPGFQMTDAQWESLLVPISMAFFYENSGTERVTAVYPSPAGGTESLLPLDTWNEIAADNPALRSMEADVEALLVNRLGARQGFSEHQYFLLPIDQCFKLVGLVRANWRGLSGGEELWQAIGRYFSALRARAGVVTEVHHA
jgi:hypothetical protein